MGGNAIVGAERFSDKEFSDVARFVSATMFHLAVHTEDYDFVKSYKEKESHGDFDVLVNKSEKWSVVKYLKETHEQAVVNGDVVSVSALPFFKNSKVVQIDYIFVDDLQMASTYFDYNDLGNLIGRVAHILGFKYGHDGLRYIFRDGTHQYGDEIVSNDPASIFEFLGYDYNIYKEGFTSLEDIFKFAASSPFFHPDIYLLHNRNNVSRTRDRKRKTYMEFLKWCEKLPHKSNVYANEEVSAVIKLEAIIASYSKFPGWMERYSDVMLEELDRQNRQSWWNGGIAREVTGFEGKKLGILMKTMKEVYNLDKCFELGINPSNLAKELMDYVSTQS